MKCKCRRSRTCAHCLMRVWEKRDRKHPGTITFPRSAPYASVRVR